MMKNKMYILLLVIVPVVAIIGSTQAFIVSPEEEGQAKPNEPNEEKSLNIARKFVENSPTYKYDGAHLKYVETITLQYPSSKQFVFEFTCRHAGYGNRSKQVLLQVITPHKAVVTVHQGEVTYAVLDGQWDMINQRWIGDAEDEKSIGS